MSDMKTFSDMERGDHGGAALRQVITPGGHPLDTSQPGFPTFHRKIGNPGPLGLGAFSTTTFLLSIYNVGAAGVKTPNVIVGMALIYGGLVQLIAGQWEFVVGNTWGATVFTSYGAFWISFAMILSPWSGIAGAFKDSAEFEKAIGFYLLSWLILTVILGAGAVRSSVSLCLTFLWLIFAFTFLIAGFFVPTMPVLHKLGGVFGILTAICGWWTMAAGILTPETSYFIVPSGSLARKD